VSKRRPRVLGSTPATGGGDGHSPAAIPRTRQSSVFKMTVMLVVPMRPLASRTVPSRSSKPTSGRKTRKGRSACPRAGSGGHLCGCPCSRLHIASARWGFSAHPPRPRATGALLDRALTRRLMETPKTTDSDGDAAVPRSRGRNIRNRSGSTARCRLQTRTRPETAL